MSIKNNDILNNKCVECKGNCLECSKKVDNCLSCEDGYYLYENKCISFCPDSQISINNECIDCQSPCQSCSKTINHCTTCIDGYYLYNTQCLTNCPIGTYESGKGCENCNSKCKTCKDENTCDSCLDGYFFYNNMCYKECFTLDDPINNKYFGKNHYDKVCTQCSESNCNKCAEDFLICTECIDSYYLVNENCVPIIIQPNNTLNPATQSRTISHSLHPMSPSQSIYGEINNNGYTSKKEPK